MLDDIPALAHALDTAALAHVDDDELVAVCVDGGLDVVGEAALGRNLLVALGHALVLVELLLHLHDALANIQRRDLEEAGGLAQFLFVGGHALVRLEACHGLDTARVGRDRGLLHDLEQTDFGRVAHMGATAQLLGERARLDDAHELAVLLAEQRGNARLASGGERCLVGEHGGIGHDDVVADALDLEYLLVGHRLEVREVEPQTVGRDERARLLDMVAQHLDQRRLQNMRGGVVAGDERTAALVDFRVHVVVLANGARGDNARVRGKIRLGLGGVFDLDGAVLVEDGARVADLAAHLSVERRLVEDDGDLVALVCLVDDLPVDDEVDDARVAVVFSVADELGRAVRVEDMRVDVAKALPGLVVACRAGALALSGHLLVKAVLVHVDAALCADLGRELVGEAIGVV